MACVELRRSSRIAANLKKREEKENTLKLINSQNGPTRKLVGSKKKVTEELRNKLVFPEPELGNACDHSRRLEVLAEELRDKLVIHKQELEKAREHNRQLELLIAKTEAAHQEKLNLLQKEHSDRILNLSAKYKKKTLKAELEGERCKNIYKQHLTGLIQRMSYLQKQLDNRTEEILKETLHPKLAKPDTLVD